MHIECKGRVARLAALYPVKPFKAIWSGFREQLKLDGMHYPGAVGMHEGIVDDQHIMLFKEDRKVDANVGGLGQVRGSKWSNQVDQCCGPFSETWGRATTGFAGREFHAGFAGYESDDASTPSDDASDDAGDDSDHDAGDAPMSTGHATQLGGIHDRLAAIRATRFPKPVPMTPHWTRLIRGTLGSRTAAKKTRCA